MANGVKVVCPECDGAKCHACAGKGQVRGVCACGHGADILAGPVPLCEGCAAVCVLCPYRVDRFEDALPFGGAGLAHTICALSFDPRILEGAVAAVESVVAVACVPQVNKSTRSPTGQHMSICSRRLKEIMRQEGFISVVEAAKLTGHATGTLYERIKRGTLKGRRSGLFHFVEIASLEAEYPQIKVPPAVVEGKTVAA